MPTYLKGGIFINILYKNELDRRDIYKRCLSDKHVSKSLSNITINNVQKTKKAFYRCLKNSLESIFKPKSNASIKIVFAFDAGYETYEEIYLPDKKEVLNFLDRWVYFKISYLYNNEQLLDVYSFNNEKLGMIVKSKDIQDPIALTLANYLYVAWKDFEAARDVPVIK